MGSNNHTELEGGVDGLFLVINDTFLVYRQLQLKIKLMSCSLNKLDIKSQ